MNSTKLKYFLAVYETKSIRKASEILNISPAALSRSIKCLEDELGQPLLIARGRGIEITATGQDLAVKSRPLLVDLDNLKKEIKGRYLAARSNSIQLGSFEIFTTYFLRSIIPLISPKDSLVLTECIPGDIEKNLLAKEIDYGITYLPVPTKGISHKYVGSIPMHIFGRPGLFDKIPLTEIPFVLPLDPLLGLSHPSDSLDGWPRSDVTRCVLYRVSLLESAIEVCRHGKAVAYLPDFIAHFHNRITREAYHLYPILYDDLDLENKRSIHLIKRQNDPETDFFKGLERALLALCQDSF